jgi:peptide/nickel transport system substrate-binding protein
MKRSGLALLAVSSSLWLGVAHAATRPQYGGTLRVAMRGIPASLDPADAAQSGSLESGNLSSLVFDTLVTLDGRGRPQPALAISWRPEPGFQRWQFKLRPGVTFQDGTPATADQVGGSLRAANPNWKVLPGGDEIIIECDSTSPDLPAELAIARNAIAKRGGPTILGTGPFAINQWEAGKRLTLTANNDYWAGRPFVDSIEITMGQGFREQMISLDLGKADLIELPPDQAHHVLGKGQRVESSSPAELMALVFTRDRPSADEGRLREALALSIDRTALSSVLLQAGGEAAGSLLPNWMTGYGFLFPASPDLAGAQRVRGEIRQASAWSLSYDTNDALARVVAERIVLNARDVSLTVQLSNSTRPDLRLVRTAMVSLDARVALMATADSLRLPRPQVAGGASEYLYAAESMLLNSQQVIPLLHLRANYGMNERVRNWTADPLGILQLSNVWLSRDQMTKP